KVLKPDQMKRFHELQYQQQGVLAAANNKELAGKLKLTDEQVSKVQKINEEYMADMRELRQGGGGPPDQETLKKMQAARKEAMTKATAVLTDEQKKTWEEM